MSDHEDEGKIHDGYHGWMKSIPKTKQDFTPVRIESAATVEAPSTQGNSAWNTAGTWEERDKSEWARERLKQLILESFAFEDGDHKLSIKANSIVTCDGDAKIVFSRGKKRCGYDISLKFEWVSTRLEEDSEGIPDASGHIEVHDFDDMTGEDYEIRVTTKGSSKHEADAKKSIMKWETKLRSLLASWKSELLQQ